MRLASDPPPAVVIEIPSVEHPVLLRVLLDEADSRNVPIRRVSQGGGLQLLTDAEVREMVAIANERGIELYLFVSTRNSFEPMVDADGRDEVVGESAFQDAIGELKRCRAVGVHGVLVADVGLLRVAGQMRAAGELGDLKIKTSVAIAPRNAAAAELYEELGATSINLAGSASVQDVAAMRARLAPVTGIDLYVESPDGLGGGLRYRHAADFVEVAAPVSLKIGLRKMPDLYPYGAHLEPAAERSMREKARRAELLLARLSAELGSARVAELMGTDVGTRSAAGGPLANDASDVS
ncbi:MAG: hypothetical protein QOE69_2808 [Thermoleophilaceae bacterium]|jgi:hypothetical protein|nr:hypothetical protein [Thermoleophilaceae bacterium]MEA2408689.1 hypothetical protein [Thermoleophilaceae bacterium]